MKTFKTLHKIIPCLAVALLAAVSSSAHAAIKTWTTGTGTADWATGANWGGTVPAENSDLVFGTTGGTTTLNQNLTAPGGTPAGNVYNSITFSAGAPSYTINGNPWILSATAPSKIENLSTATQTINLGLGVNGVRTFAATSGNIVYGGMINSFALTGGVTKTGNATVTLSGANTYAGVTTISAGTLEVNKLQTFATSVNDGRTIATTAGSNQITLSSLPFSNNAAMVGMSINTLENAGALWPISPSATILSVVDGAGSTKILTMSQNATSTVSGKFFNMGFANSLGITTNAAANLVFSGNSALRYTGNSVTTPIAFTVNNGITGTVDVSNAATTLTMNASTVSAATTGSIVKAGAGTLVVSGNLSNTGGTSYLGVTAGTLVISGTANINGFSRGAGGNIAVTGGTFDYQNNSVSLNRTVTVNGGTFKNNSSQNYTGVLTFTSGTVGGTNLSGVALTIGANQTISPGNSPGTITTAGETWTGGGTYVWEINNATGAQGTNWDFINGSGVLDISALSSGSQFNINVIGLNGSNVSGAVQNWNGSLDGQFWKIATFTSINGTFASNLFNVDVSGFTNNNPASGTFSVTNTGNDLFLSYAVPEPNTWLLLAATGTFFMVMRRRRQE